MYKRQVNNCSGTTVFKRHYSEMKKKIEVVSVLYTKCDFNGGLITQTIALFIEAKLHHILIE